MKILSQISDGLEKFTTRYYIIPLIFLFAVLAVIIDRGPNGNMQLKAMSDGVGMLDMQRLGYSETTAYGLLEQIGSGGRADYVQLLGLDFVFAVVYMLMQSVLLTNLLQRAQISGFWKRLNLLPWLRSALDVLENCLLLAIIFNFPARLNVLVFAASTLTLLKWLVYSIVIVLLFSLGAWNSIQAHRPQKKLQKVEKTA